MRKRLYYIVMIAILASQTVLGAPSWKGANRNIHHVAVWGGAGYSGLMNQYDNNRFVGGGGGLIGVGYEYKYDHFILNVGPEFRIFSSMDKVTFPATYDVMTMAPGYTQTKHYTFADPLKENHIAGQLMLPIMAGGTWDKVYFLAGMKVGYTLFGTYSQKGTYSTSITDESAYDPAWMNMANHGAVTDKPYSASGKNNYGLDIAATAEVGVNINGFMDKRWNDDNKKRPHPIYMRVAAFVDYGVANLSPKQEGPMAMADENDIHTRSLHTSEWATGRLNSLLVGVKFTALLQMNKPKPPKPEKPAMVIEVVDAETYAGINVATVDVTPKEGKAPRTMRRTTNKKGLVTIKTAPGPYHLALSHPEYEPLEHEYSHGDWNDTLTLAMTPKPKPEPEPEPIIMLDDKPVVREQPIIMKNLFFATNETTILPESEPELQRLLKLLNEHPQLRIRITGHTDNVGSDQDNQILSEGRANSVRNYLIERGVDADRIEAEGKGESQPITTNDTEEGRAQNRRVEFMIL